MYFRFALALHRPLRLALLLATMLPLAALLAPRFAAAQGPGTKYIACIDQAEADLAMCYFMAADRWRERLCNFAYYADTVACTADFLF